MRKFIFQGITTVVEDDDRRIAEYLENGWKEIEYENTSIPSEQGEILQSALKDVVKSEKAAKKKTTASKKVTAAAKAKSTAAKQKKPVNDGLLKGGK